jgi:hypothetical protein
MLYVSTVLKIKMHVVWVLNITCLIPEDGQYSRNIQHELTDLIKVVVVDCNIYVNLYCTSQRDGFYENYTVSLLDEPRSVERWYNDSNGEKSNYSGKEPFPMPLQPPQILNRMTRDWTRISRGESSVTNRLSHGRGTASSRRYSSKVSLIFVGFNQNLMLKRSWYINSEYEFLRKFVGRKSHFMRTEEF